MAKLLKLRRGTTSQHRSFTGAEGEVTVDTDKETLVVHDGSTTGGFPVARADGIGVANFTITGELDAATLDISGNADVDGTLEADAYTVNGTTLNEYIADTVGAMVTGNTETGIAVTYEDSDNTLDFVVGTLNQNTTGTAANLSGTPDITVGVVTAGSLDISGNADIDGTLEADAYTVNGTALDTHIAGVTVTNATNAAHVSVADNESTNENNLITFIENASATGNVGLESDGDFHYNPSTGLLTTPAISTSGNITIAGNLTVNGTTTTVATTNTTVTDNLLELNSGASSNANDSGILIERGSTGDNAIIAWDESADKFTVGTTTATNDATGNISITTGTIVANVEGNVTGNVTGTASSATNADTVDNLHASNFLRSDANDSFSSGTLTITSTDDYPLTFNNSSDAKIDLQGSTTPYIRFRESATEKAFIQWSTSGFFQLVNQEDSSRIRIKDAIDFSADGTNYYNIIHQNNVGSSGSLSSVTVYTSAVHDSKGNLRSIPLSNKTGAHVLAAADAGKVVYISTGGVTFDNSIMSEGDAVTIINNSGSDQTITQGSGCTLYNTADASTGNRTLAGRGMCTIWFKTAAIGYISGAGLS